ncbi:MAG: DMT family transporter [Woeseiaceae bacterium]
MTSAAPKTFLLTAVAMLAFAANSLLCRLALGLEQIDAASFTSVRIISGALAMGLMILPGIRSGERSEANWRSVLALFSYMICFSLAYLSLAAGTGALILFGAVQITMIVSALSAGERFPAAAWFGLALAIIGLVYLVSPGVTSPDPTGAMLMAIAGIAWGFYSLFGRTATNPMQSTAYNFLYSVPLALLVSALLWNDFHLTPAGVGLAITSGVLASGFGYYVWYLALRNLAAIQAATVQLSVPVIAAIGGVILIAEPVTIRLVVASVATLGGIAIVLTRRRAG